MLWRTLGYGPKMNAVMLRIPAALGGDSSDVAVALEVADALCEKGDNQEAVRWLKRAADAAAQAGDSARAATFTQVAGDFEAALETQRRPAPPPAPASTAQPAALDDTRLRVSVKTSVRDPNLLLLRPLPEGQSPPVGTREGFLVLAQEMDESAPPLGPGSDQDGGENNTNGHGSG